MKIGAQLHNGYEYLVEERCAMFVNSMVKVRCTMFMNLISICPNKLIRVYYAYMNGLKDEQVYSSISCGSRMHNASVD